MTPPVPWHVGRPCIEADSRLVNQRVVVDCHIHRMNLCEEGCCVERGRRAGAIQTPVARRNWSDQARRRGLSGALEVTQPGGLAAGAAVSRPGLRQSRAPSHAACARSGDWAPAKRRNHPGAGGVVAAIFSAEARGACGVVGQRVENPPRGAGAHEAGARQHLLRLRTTGSHRAARGGDRAAGGLARLVPDRGPAPIQPATMGQGA